jgi:AraC-like DNA-binding protein
MRLLSSLMFMLEASKSENNKALAEYFLNDIFIQIDAEKILISVSKDPLIEEIIQFFKENIKENVSLEILINKFGISKSGLIKRFNDVTGFTPMQYLSNLRLKEAEELLITSDLTLSQIADNCGFDNAFYLSNAFKKVKGMAPRYFREKHRI